MKKIPWASQNTEAKILSSDVCFFGHFGLLSPAAVYSGDCLFDSEGKWWTYVSSIVTYLCRKHPFCCVETVANNALNHRCIVVFGWLLANTAPTFNAAFSLTNVHAKWWIYFLLISSTPLLSHATSIYNRPKQVCGDFWCFLEQLLYLGNLGVQHHLCLYDRI